MKRPSANKPSSVLIIESPSANLNSIYIALERIQAELKFDLKISSDTQEILAADRVIFPGVGHASFIMQKLRQSGLDQVIGQIKKPLMGICLGMQLLFEELCEAGQSGLGLLPGKIVPLRVNSAVPHMGWNSICPTANQDTQDMQDMQDMLSNSQNSFCYFVHSYFAPISELTLAYCEYGNTKISAIVRGKERPNIWGCQFHPEKSGAFGAQVLYNWLTLPDNLADKGQNKCRGAKS